MLIDDLAKAGVEFEDLLVAADEGSPEDQYAVGMCNVARVGVERNISKGARYFSRSFLSQERQRG